MNHEKKKYVVVLAHADGWGALSANKVIKHLHDHYPDVGVHLIVSQATKNKDGGIITKLDDLKTPRELKETNLLDYFKRIDAIYDDTSSFEETRRMLDSGVKPAGVTDEDLTQYYQYYIELGRRQAQIQSTELLTFNQLAKRYCADEKAHYTTRGGPKGGEEVEAVITALENEHGQGPEVLLSVDTMAILPKNLLEKYQCFSAHPGPLDTIKIEGMQGTLRSLVNQVLFDREGKPLPKEHVLGIGEACVKGTLFLQHPELDKGPPIEVVQTFVCPGLCAYQVRDEVYHALTDAMLAKLPILLDPEKRAALIEQATRDKERSDAQPHQHIGELEPEAFAKWQGGAIAVPSDDAPWGVEVIQNAIVNPIYFQNQMRRFFPGTEREFKSAYDEVYAKTLDKVAGQQNERLTDPWARLAAGDPNITIRRLDPKTGKVIQEFRNR